MRINKDFLYASACILSPIFTCAMQMAPDALALPFGDKSTRIGQCFDKGLVCVCGPCCRAGDLASKKMTNCCIGTELPMSVSCQACSYCSMQLLFWAPLVRGEMRPEVGHAGIVDLCAISAGGTACLAYLAHRLERLQARCQVALPAEDETNSSHSKVE